MLVVLVGGDGSAPGILDCFSATAGHARPGAVDMRCHLCNNGAVTWSVSGVLGDLVRAAVDHAIEVHGWAAVQPAVHASVQPDTQMQATMPRRSA